jgi:hypothetical protein
MASIESVAMRNPFLKITIGSTTTHRVILFQFVRGKKWLANTLVIRRASEDQMPLHSSAARIATPGNSKTNP